VGYERTFVCCRERRAALGPAALAARLDEPQREHVIRVRPGRRRGVGAPGSRQRIATAQIRQLAGIPPAVRYGSMNDLMKQLVDDGRVVREGRSSGTRYQIRRALRS
jgi:hypothetical protein